MHDHSESDRFPTQVNVKAVRINPLFVAAWIGVAMFSAPLLGQELALERLATRCDYTAGRITSHDPKGANQDFWVIAPGETRVLAEIKGPGSIVHFRDNITSRRAAPPTTSRPAHLLGRRARTERGGTDRRLLRDRLWIHRENRLRPDDYRPAARLDHRSRGFGGRPKLLHSHAVRPLGANDPDQRGEATKPALVRAQLPELCPASARSASTSTPSIVRARRRRRALT